VDPFDLLRPIAAAQIQPRTLEVVRGDRVERLRARPGHVFRDRLGALRPSLELAAQPHEAIRFRVRQRLQQHGVDHREDRGVRADPERQRGHGDQAEARVLENRATCVADVGEE
jgi:hypothetical protein